MRPTPTRSAGMTASWLTSSALSGLPGLPDSPFRRRELLDRSGVAKRPRTAQGGGHEYRVADLPEATQQALAARAVNGAALTLRAENAGSAAHQETVTRQHAESMARLGVTLEAAGALDPARNPRLDLFQRFELYHHQRGIAAWPAVIEFCAQWNAGRIEAFPTTLTAIPTLVAKTMDRWVRDWRTKGVEALLQAKPRSDKGRTRLDDDKELYTAFVAAVAGMQEPTWRQVQRVISNQVGEERTPPPRTLRRWLADYRDVNKVALLKLKNPDGWRNKYMPAFGSRSEHVTVPNQEWQLDSTIADAMQRSEIIFSLHDGETGEVRRHALVAQIDVHTRRANVLVSRTSNANAVKAVVRRAILNQGLPRTIKTDNGRDYTAVDFDFALSSLKVDHKLCTPFSPDQKPFIERFLGTLLHDLFPMLHGFVGHDVTTRKAIESGLSFAQRFGHTDGVRLHMTPEQLQGVIDGWLDEYHDRVHGELRCSPNAMAERHATQILMVDERALDIFLMKVAGNGIRTVGKRGITLGNAWFRAPELARVDVMGREVYCRQDEADLGELHVFNLDGGYICKAIDHTRKGINCAELAARTRVMETETVKPLVDALRKAKRAQLPQKAVAAIYADRADQAVDAATNVTRLAPRVVMHETPAVRSVVSGETASAADTARAAARAALAEQAEAAPVVELTTPKSRYSAWVRLKSRLHAEEAVSPRELEWSRSYEGSNEFKALDALHCGEDPLAAAAGG